MSSIGRNSMIMAAGTLASRITGQLRQILLAAAIGTTGIAAMAYQTGSQIPQVVFNLISGGIFNAVLVPQIVRALKQADAKERLDKLITAAISLLIAVTAVMMAATPWITQLYINSSWTGEQRALANAFTLWCMPQIFFYGLYTVLGQILAAKERFGMYAWSSVGANVVSCLGFSLFIWEFGNAAMRPVDWWTEDKIMLTAGAWTAGVAFQALILFAPLTRLGLHYRPRFGLKGIGLRSMGRVAVWSMALVVLNLIMGMVNAQVLTGAPVVAHDLHGVAGNASYQYAYSLQILPYSLIAVSICTALFPKLSRSVADHDLDTARKDLSSSMRSLIMIMTFFTVVLVVIPAPITITLVPTVGLGEAQLIAGPLVTLSLSLVPISLFLLIQRTFYAFEDGKNPFLFAALQNLVQAGFLFISIAIFPAQYWASLVGLAITVSFYLTIPFIFIKLRRRFNGSLDGRRIALLTCKTLVAGCVAFAASWAAQWLLGFILPFDDPSLGKTRRWVYAIVVCALVTIVAAACYAAMLWLLRTREFTALMGQIMRRIGGRFHRGDSGRGNTRQQADSRPAANADTNMGTGAATVTATGMGTGTPTGRIPTAIEPSEPARRDREEQQ